MKKHRILLADDNDDILAAFQEGLESHGFDVVPAANVNEALRLISIENFDMLLSDLHMPDACDGFTVVNAMRHTQPNAVTLVLSGYPVLQAALSGLLLQADQVLVKPIGFAEITEIIQKKLANPSVHMAMNKERVAEILERDLDQTIQSWMSRVEHTEELTAISLTYQERTAHLPCCWATSCAAYVSHPVPRVPFPVPLASMGFCDASKGTLSPWWWKSRESCRSASAEMWSTTFPHYVVMRIMWQHD